MQKGNRFLKGVFVFSFAAILLGGCGASADDEGAESGTGTATEETDNILYIAKDTDIVTLDTNVATDGLSFEVIDQFTDGLLGYDAEGTIISEIAESYEASEDGLVYTFTLRDDAVWSNGEPVTANDFVYSWQRLADPDTASDYNFMVQTAGITNATEVVNGEADPSELGVTAEDDYTLVVELDAAVPYFDQLMTFPVFNPINQAFAEEQGDQYGLTADNVLSNGPFILTNWTSGNGWSLEKNPDYYDADSVTIEGLEYSYSADYQSSAMRFDSGQIDLTKISADLVDGYQDTDAYTQVESGYVWFLEFNVFDNEQLANENLRLALGYAIDRDNITDNIMKDGSMPADYIIPKGLASLDGQDFRDTADTYLGYDLDMANEYLEKAKAELGVDEFSFELLIEDSEESAKNASQIQIDLAEIGVNVDITSVPKSERLDRMNDANHDFEIGLTRWGPDYADPYTYLGDRFGPANALQIETWNNETFNDLVASVGPGGDLANDPEARWEAMKEAEAELLETAIIVPVWQTGESMLINPNVTGVEMHVVGATNYRYATID